MKHRTLNHRLFLFAVVLASPLLMHAQAKPAAATSASVTVSLIGSDGQLQSVDAATLRTMPRTTVHVHNAHTNKDESYEGVELATVLARVATPLGAKLHGKPLGLIVIATGADGYRAVYSLAEIDPEFHNGHVILADHVDGQPVGDKEGPLKLVNTEDKRPARWVRNLVSLQVETAP